MLKHTADFLSAHRIITHPGQAHRDDLLAVAFALAVNPKLSVFRRDPQPVELADQSTIVIDVGLKHDPAFLNFDHHQFPRDFEPMSALTLVLEHLGVLDAARMTFGWVEFTEVLDSKGPVQAAKWLGTSMDKFHATISPVEVFVLSAFQDVPASGLHPGDPLHAMLVSLGTNKLRYVERFAERFQKLCKFAVIKHLDLEGGKKLEVVDVSFITKAEDPLLALEAWIKTYFPTAAATISLDDRGDGTTVFRRNDHPRLDFSVLEGKEGTVFAHKSGFVAKLAYGVDPLVAIRQSIKPE